MSDPAIPEGRQPENAAVERSAGTERIRTSIEISKAAHDMMGDMAGMPHTVVIARADDYADALVGAPLARRLSAPLLLTGRDGLHPEVAAELRRLNADRAYVLGGDAALGAGVDRDLRAAGIDDVQRVFGPTRFDTASRIARLLGGTQAYLVEGINDDPNRGWPDAVAVSGLAASQIRPILLTTATTLPATTLDTIEDLGVRNLSIIGGPVAVSEAQEAALSQRVPYVERLSGATRYETSVAVAERSALNVMDPYTVWMATGRSFPDALTAGASAGHLGAIVLLVDGAAETLGGAAADWLDGRYHPTDEIRLIGGDAAISDAFAASLR
jgi:putative cell wall-binding protein